MLNIGTVLQRRRYWLWGLSVVIVLVVGGWVIWQWQWPLPASQVADQPYSAVRVGQTSTDQLTEAVGEPYTSFNSGGFEVRSQKSAKSPYKPDLFYIKDGTVVMKEIWYEPTLYYYSESQLVEELGKPESVKYVSPINDVLVKALLYTRRGVVAYIQNDIKAVWHIQYFTPMSEASYLKIWGSTLVAEVPEQTFQAEPSP